MPALKTLRPVKVPRNAAASNNRIDVIPNDVNEIKTVLDAHADDLDANVAAADINTAAIDINITAIADKESGADPLLSVGTNSGSDAPTINQPAGKITTAVTGTAALANKTITLTNSFITVDSIVMVSLGDYGGAGTPLVFQVTPAAGSCVILIYNAHATDALSAAFDIDFVVVG